MCGFSGYLNLDTENVISNDRVLRASARAIAHRGPDDEDVWYEGNVGMAHRRLSILDTSSAGRQPFFSADGRYVIVYNGEIYNYQEFIPELEKKGYRLKTSTDTEVLLYLWIEYGAQALHRLNGMWAFALWDRKEKNLVLCRDRLGVKPLYYALTDQALYFGSEPKALFALGMDRVLDHEALREHFVFRYVDGDRTLFRRVKKLLPGYLAEIIGDQAKMTRWWNLMERANAFKAIKEPIQWFDNLFHESVKYRMVSDVPVGLLLSGGLDSSSVAQALSNIGIRQIDTFNIRFRESEHDESHLASLLSKSIGYRPHHLLVEGPALLRSTIEATQAADQPLVHQNDGHLVAIADYARSYVKVLLSGEGADELMGGYVRYKPFRYIKPLNILRKLLPLIPLSSSRIQKLGKFLFSPDPDLLMMWSANNFFPSDLKALGFSFEEKTEWREKILNEARQLNHNDIIKKLLYLEQHTYLQSLLDRNDTTTMMSGIECREPFLDYRIVEGMMSLPSNFFVRGKKGKYILLSSIGKRLPQEIQDFRKVGLSVPWSEYLRHNQLYSSYLNSFSELEEILMINIKNTLEDFKKGDDNHEMLIRYLFFFNIWKSTF